MGDLDRDIVSKTNASSFAGQAKKAKYEVNTSKISERSIHERLRDYSSVYEFKSDEELVNYIRNEAPRCNCATSQCQVSGCGINRPIPESLRYKSSWGDIKRAFYKMASVSPFLWTSDLCPENGAPCEQNCTLSVNSVKDAVKIRSIEYALKELGKRHGWFDSLFEAPSPEFISKEIQACNLAIIGSGPAGLQAAYDAMRLGLTVTVFDKADKLGGLLRYGIPDFKYEKSDLDFYVSKLLGMGLNTRLGVNIGTDISLADIAQDFNAIIIATGVTNNPRSIEYPEAAEVIYAMDYLVNQNKLVAGDSVADQFPLSGQDILIIGAGDTASDCIGTSLRKIYNHKSCEINGSITRLDRQVHKAERNTSWPFESDEILLSSSEKELISTERGTIYQAVPSQIFVENGKCMVTIAKRELVDPSMRLLPKAMREYRTISEELCSFDKVILALGFSNSHKKDLEQQVAALHEETGIFCSFAGDIHNSSDKWLIVHAMQSAKDVVLDLYKYLQTKQLVSF